MNSIIQDEKLLGMIDYSWYPYNSQVSLSIYLFIEKETINCINC